MARKAKLTYTTKIGEKIVATGEKWLDAYLGARAYALLESTYVSQIATALVICEQTGKVHAEFSSR